MKKNTGEITDYEYVTIYLLNMCLLIDCEIFQLNNEQLFWCNIIFQNSFLILTSNKSQATGRVIRFYISLTETFHTMTTWLHDYYPIL